MFEGHSFHPSVHQLTNGKVIKPINTSLSSCTFTRPKKAQFANIARLVKKGARPTEKGARLVKTGQG
jgi:hypothetical protein